MPDSNIIKRRTTRRLSEIDKAAFETRMIKVYFGQKQKQKNGKFPFDAEQLAQYLRNRLIDEKILEQGQEKTDDTHTSDNEKEEEEKKEKEWM